MARRQTLSLLVTICLGHILLISAQVQSKSGLPVIESLAFDVFAKFQALTAGIADAGRNVWTSYFALRGAARENEALKGRILELETALQQEQAVAGRTRALEEALALQQSQPLQTLTARVIAGNPSPGALTVTIDRGSADGVDVDLAVMGSQGIVGRVILPVAAHAATVQLLIAPNAAAAVTFERSNAGGLVVGRASDPPLFAEYVPAAADVHIGEKVMTSGQDGIYPVGFPIGMVERVTPGGTEREIGIRPSVDFSHIDVVLVLLTRPPRPEDRRR
jgi:rod shape-determining protein MreC